MAGLAPAISRPCQQQQHLSGPAQPPGKICPAFPCQAEWSYCQCDCAGHGGQL